MLGIDNDLREAIDTFREIQGVSAKTAKEEIIRKNQNNETFAMLLEFLYDDMVTTGIAIKKWDKVDYFEDGGQEISIYCLINYVKEYNTGRDSAVRFLKTATHKLPDDDYEFMKQLFTKTFKCGITSKTINKAFDKPLIVEYACQLAHPYEKHMKKVEGSSFTLTRKLDGYRTQIMFDGDNIQFFSRKGKPVLGLNELTEYVKQFKCTNFPEVDYVLDGEVVLIDPTGEKTEAELFQATSSAMRKDGDKKNIAFHIFDIVPKSEFLHDKISILSFAERRKIIDRFKYTNEFIKPVEVVYEGQDVDQIEYFLENVAKPKGWEGLMLNINDAKYQCKRNAGILKIKPFYSSDIEVIDVYEGEKGKKYEGMAGGIVCRFKDFTVEIGSGLTDEQRELWFNDPSQIIGKIVEIQYFEETISKDGDKGLRFPTLKSVREEKSVEDISYES